MVQQFRTDHQRPSLSNQWAEGVLLLQTQLSTDCLRFKLPSFFRMSILNRLDTSKHELDTKAIASVQEVDLDKLSKHHTQLKMLLHPPSSRIQFANLTEPLVMSFKAQPFDSQIMQTPLGCPRPSYIPPHGKLIAFRSHFTKWFFWRAHCIDLDGIDPGVTSRRFVVEVHNLIRSQTLAKNGLTIWKDMNCFGPSGGMSSHTLHNLTIANVSNLFCCDPYQTSWRHGFSPRPFRFIWTRFRVVDRSVRHHCNSNIGCTAPNSTQSRSFSCSFGMSQSWQSSQFSSIPSRQPIDLGRINSRGDQPRTLPNPNGPDVTVENW